MIEAILGLAARNAWIRAGRSRALIFTVMAISIIQVSCDSDPRIQKPKLANGWVTDCSGPDFSRVAQPDGSNSAADRPVFRIADQLVLAVPKANWPSAGGVDHEPRECKSIGDVPRAQYLYFLVSGNWSAGYRPEDIPSVDGSKQFQPDVATVRIEQERPSNYSAEDERRIDQMRQKADQEESTGVREIGGLTCFVPKPATTFFVCSGPRSNRDSDVVRLRYRGYSNTPFLLVQADYPSSRHGGIRMNWQAWIKDAAQAREVDEAIWLSIENWNLLNKTGMSGERRPESK